MRNLRDAKSAFHYAVPRIKQAKEMSVQQQDMYNKIKASDDSTEIGWQPQNAEQIYEGGMQQIDTSQMVSGRQVKEDLSKIVSPMQQLVQELTNFNPAEGLSVEGSKSFANRWAGANLKADLPVLYNRLIQSG